MRSHLEKLVALLEHKHTILLELTERQRSFKEFLINPEWHRFFEYTQPQEQLLNKLRQIQAAQDFLLAEIAADRNVARIATLKALCRFLDPEWQRAVLDLVAKIGEATHELRKFTRLSQVLNQSHWRFVQRYMNEGHGRKDLGCYYNSNGTTHRQAMMYGRFSGQA